MTYFTVRYSVNLIYAGIVRHSVKSLSRKDIMLIVHKYASVINWLPNYEMYIEVRRIIYYY